MTSLRLVLAFCLAVLPVSELAAEGGVFSPRIAYSDKSMKFLSVFAEKYTQNEGLRGLFIDKRGDAKTPFFISKNLIIKHTVTYAGSKDIFLVPYHYCKTGCVLEGQIVYSDGSILDTPVQIAINTYGFGKVVAAADDAASRFLVVWLDYRSRSNPQIFGRYINYDGTVTEPEVVLMKTATTLSDFGLVRDSANNRFLFVYSSSDVNGFGVFAQIINDNLTPDRTVKAAVSNDYSCNVSPAYSAKDRLLFVAYSDYLAGVSAYNIKAFTLDENLKVFYTVDITSDSLHNRYPDTAYNPFMNSFVVTYMTKPPQGTISNVALSSVNVADGKIVDKYLMDKTGKLTIMNPSVAVNTLCPNGVVLCENYDALTLENSLGKYFFGDLCRFALSVTKKGDGSGKVLSEPAGIDCGSVCSAEYTDGDSIKLTAIPDESSLFASFSGTQCIDEPVCSVVVDSEKKVEAEFILKTFMIKTTAGPGGKVLPENPFVKYGAGQKVDIIPDNGYVIEDVLVDNISAGAVSSYSFTNVTSDHTLSATFRQEKIFYKISASASEGGSISPSGDIQVGAGESITFQITPSNGYYLSYAEVDGENIGKVNTYTFTNIDRDHTIYARFEPHLDEWDIDGGTKDVTDDSTGPDSGSLVTEVKNGKDSGCGCSLLE